MMDPSGRREADHEPGDWVAGPVVSRGRSPAPPTDLDSERLGPLVVPPPERPAASSGESEASARTGTPPDEPEPWTGAPEPEPPGGAAESEDLPWLTADERADPPADAEEWTSEEAPQPYLESWGASDLPTSAFNPAAPAPADPVMETDLGVTGDEVTEAMTRELLGEVEETPPEEPVDWSPRPGYSAAAMRPGASSSRETATWELVTPAGEEPAGGASGGPTGAEAGDGDGDGERTGQDALASASPFGAAAPDDAAGAEERESSGQVSAGSSERDAASTDAGTFATGDPTPDQARALATRLERIARALREQGPGGALSQRRGDPLAALITGYLLGSADPVRGRDADADDGEPEPDPR